MSNNNGSNYRNENSILTKVNFRSQHRPDDELITLIMPALEEGIRRMRFDDEQTAMQLLGAAVRKKTSRGEHCRIGELVLQLANHGNLSVKNVSNSGETPLYRRPPL